MFSMGLDTYVISSTTALPSSYRTLYLCISELTYAYAVVGEANKEKAQLSMGQASEFSLSVEEYDINELEADITTPTGKSEPCILKKLPNGHLGNPHVSLL